MLIGRDEISQELEVLAKKPSSIAIVGLPGTGKRHTAKTLSKSILCGCDNCSVCSRIDRDIFPDVVYFASEKKKFPVFRLGLPWSPLRKVRR